MSMTDKEVVDGAERAAREMMRQRGYLVEDGVLIRNSLNPRLQEAWRTVGAMLEAYNGTDLPSAVDSVDDEFCPEAGEPKVALGAGHLHALLESKLGSCSCLTKTPDPVYHKEDCRYRCLCEIEQVIQAGPG